MTKHPTIGEQLDEDERRKFYTDDLVKEAREDAAEIKRLRKMVDEATVELAAGVDTMTRALAEINRLEMDLVRASSTIMKAHDTNNLLSDKNLQLRGERNNLYGHVCGLMGLTELICARDDVSEDFKESVRASHRVRDAAEYLKQIVPPK